MLSRLYLYRLTLARCVAITTSLWGWRWMSRFSVFGFVVNKNSSTTVLKWCWLGAIRSSSSSSLVWSQTSTELTEPSPTRDILWYRSLSPLPYLTEEWPRLLIAITGLKMRADTFAGDEIGLEVSRVDALRDVHDISDAGSEFMSCLQQPCQYWFPDSQQRDGKDSSEVDRLHRTFCLCFWMITKQRCPLRNIGRELPVSWFWVSTESWWGSRYTCSTYLNYSDPMDAWERVHRVIDYLRITRNTPQCVRFQSVQVRNLDGIGWTRYLERSRSLGFAFAMYR